MTAPWIAAFVSLWAFVVVLAILVLGVVRRVTVALERAEAAVSASSGVVPTAGAAPGSELPLFEVRDRENQPVSSSDLLARTRLVLFMESGCGPCQRLAAGLGSLRDIGVPLTAILDDSPAGHSFPLPEGVDVVFQLDRRASRAFSNVASPEAFLTADGGLVVDRSFPGAIDDLRRLAEPVKGGESELQFVVATVDHKGAEDEHPDPRLDLG